LVTIAVAIAGAAMVVLVVTRSSSVTVDYGPLSTEGRTRVGRAPADYPVLLQLGLVADQKSIADAAKSGSDPSSSSYGTYPTLAQLSADWGASEDRRRDVLAALSAQGIHGTVSADDLVVTAPATIGELERLFSAEWHLYKTDEAGQLVALPESEPDLPSGLEGNVDIVAGVRPLLYESEPPGEAEAAAPKPPSTTAPAEAVDGGTPTRTGTFGDSCLDKADPAFASSSVGLSPRQILTAYGIAPLHERGLQGQGVRLAIVGEAPTPIVDVEAFRRCFGFTGTPLEIHGGAGVQPILESSLDAMVVSMVAPKLDGFDLWVSSLDEDADDGDVEGFHQLLRAPLQATADGAQLPDVISVSYGTCENTVAPFTAARTLVERTLAVYAALGITVTVAAGDSGSSTCSRGIPPPKLTMELKRPFASWPATSPWVLGVGGTNLTLQDDNTIASTGVWNDTVYPAPYDDAAGGGGGESLFVERPWWQPSPPSGDTSSRTVPDVAAFADSVPGYVIVCSPQVQGCGGEGATVTFVGGTSAATPLVAGMIALWTQYARENGLKRPGFVPPLVYELARDAPTAFVDVTKGGNAIYDVACCRAGPGYDLASGNGSPLADKVAAELRSVSGG
jgi:subtilase family serine protease